MRFAKLKRRTTRLFQLPINNRAAGLPQPGSNRGYRPEQLITQFMLSVWCGANRFKHGEVTRHDQVLKRLFGFTRMVNFKAIMRLFRKFTQSTKMMQIVGSFAAFERAMLRERTQHGLISVREGGRRVGGRNPDIS